MLAERYGYTPQEIADMTYSQQIMMLRGKSTMTFRSMQEFMQWTMSPR
jgi:hypothetical protein